MKTEVGGGTALGGYGQHGCGGVVVLGDAEAATKAAAKTTEAGAEIGGMQWQRQQRWIQMQQRWTQGQQLGTKTRFSIQEGQGYSAVLKQDFLCNFLL